MGYGGIYMRQYFGLAITAMLSLALISCVTANSFGKLETVQNLDVTRYMGKWYEVARYQHTFEKGLVGVTAEYSLRQDGKVTVLNSGSRGRLDGKREYAKAVARVPDPGRPSALKVKFFNLFESDYLVFGLDEAEYQWALVGNDTRDYLWFLSRTPQISAELLNKMKGMAESMGYDVSKLYMVPQ
jgi:apolipoprotein D and lipocalin family protein